MFGWGSKFILVGGAWIAGGIALLVGKHSGYPKDRIIFGNYQDYISPGVIANLKEKHKVFTDYFEVDQIVKEKFRNGIYDAAIVSGATLLELSKHNLNRKIDWSKLGLESDKESIFSDVVKTFWNSENAESFDYGIPYFMQKLSFCYSGPEISDLKSEVSWSRLLEIISAEERFKSKDQGPKLALIDDPRTLLSLSRMVLGKDSVNPTPEELADPDFIFSDYKAILNKGLNEEKMGKNFRLVSSNSSDLVDALASKTVSGGFMYNGDCLFASQGGNLGDKYKFKGEDFHVAQIDKDIYFLDFITISKSISEEKLNKTYEFIKELLFFSDHKEQNPLDKNGDEEQEYKHVPTRNFDYVQYTPVLKNLLDKAVSEYYTEEKLSDVQKRILEIKNIDENIGNKKYRFEFDFTEKQNSNMIIAFERFKSLT